MSYIFIIWKNKWNLKGNRNKWEHQGACFAEASFSEAPFSEKERINDLVNVSGIPLLTIDKTLNELCLSEESRRDENETDEHSKSHFQFITNEPRLLNRLISDAVANNVEQMGAAFNNYNVMINAQMASLITPLQLQMMKLCIKIKEVITELLNQLEENKIREFKTFYDQMKQGPIEDVNYVKQQLHKLECSIYLSSLDSLKKCLKYIRKKKVKLESFIEKTTLMIYTFHTLGVDVRKKFPLSFIKEDVKINNEDTARELISIITEDLNGFIALGKKNRRNFLTHSLNIVDLQFLIDRSSRTLGYVKNKLHSTNYKLIKYLNNVVDGSLLGILSLFLYVFKTSETKNKNYFSKNKIMHEIFTKAPYIKTHVKKINDLEKQLIVNGKSKFHHHMETLFGIDVTDKKLSILIKQLARSNHIERIMESLSEFVTLIIFKNFLIDQNKLLKKIEQYINIELPYLKLTNEQHLRSIYAEELSSFLGDIECSFKVQNESFNNMMLIVQNRKEAMNSFSQMLQSMDQFKKFAEFLLMIEKEGEALGMLVNIESTFSDESETFTCIPTETKSKMESNTMEDDFNSLKLNNKKDFGKLFFLLYLIIQRNLRLTC